MTVKGGVGKVVEYAGPGVATLSVPERAVITNMGAELGATTSIFPSDDATKAFLTAMEKCTGCATCAKLCPDVAIKVWRTVKSKAKENANVG